MAVGSLTAGSALNPRHRAEQAPADAQPCVTLRSASLHPPVPRQRQDLVQVQHDLVPEGMQTEVSALLCASMVCNLILALVQGPVLSTGHRVWSGAPAPADP